jgi:peptide/nickel transport system substrate-binding protein
MVGSSARWLAVGTALALITLVSACVQPPAQSAGTASAAPKSGGTLRVGIATDVLTLDLPNFQSAQDLQVGDQIFDTLVGYDKDLRIQPRLAESWKQVDDTTYQFTLRKNVKFEDGTPLNAAAVKTHFDRARTGQRQSSYYNAIESVTAIDDLTVGFKLKSPFAAFLQNLALATGGIESPAALNTFASDIAHHPVGTGPYKLSEWVPGVRVVLERNPDYWGSKPKLDKVVFTFLQDESVRMAGLDAGEQDVIQNAPPQRIAGLKSSSTLQLITGPYSQSFFLGMTATNPLLKDIRVRQAIAMTIDSKALVEGVTDGVVRIATGFVPPELMPITSKPIQHDPTKAKQLLADAGYANGLTIDLWTPNGRYLRDKEIAEVIQAQLKPIGIDATIKVLEYPAFVAGLGRHEAGLFLLGWQQTASPDTMLRAVFLSKSPINWSAYSNPKVDQLLDQAVGQPSFEKAVPLWQQADQALLDDVAGVPIYWSVLLYAGNRKVHDFLVDSLGNLNLVNTWIE